MVHQFVQGTLELKLFHRVMTVSTGGGPADRGQLAVTDLLIGSAEVDLSPLLYPSMDELNGKTKPFKCVCCLGEIKVLSLTPGGDARTSSHFFQTPPSWDVR